MTKRFDLYGWEKMPLHEAAGRVGRALGLTLRLHDSSYRGGEYFLWRGDEGEELIIQENFEDDEGYLAEPEHSSYETLLYASGFDSQTYEKLDSVASLTSLRSELL